METHLYHEVLYASVEDGVVVIPHLAQPQEVLAGAWCQVAVKFHVEVTQVGVQPQVACRFACAGTINGDGVSPRSHDHML